MLKKFLVLSSVFIVFNTKIFALDNNYNTNKNIQINKSKSINRNKSININKNKTKSKTISKNKSLSENETRSYTKLEQLNMLTVLLTLEYSNIKPFSTCKVLSHPEFAADFGLSCTTKTGLTNLGRCEYLKEAKINNYYLQNVIDENNIKKLKRYMTCIGLYGALIAQNIKTNKINFVLKDKELINIFKAFTNSLQNSKCKLINDNEVNCGAITITLKSIPVLEFAGIKLFSDKEFYSYTSSVQHSKSKVINKNITLQVALSKSKAISLSKSITDNNTLHMQLQQQANHNLSLSPLLPKE